MGLLMVIPDFLLVHTVTIEPLTGQGSHGPVYGPPTTIRCLIEDKRRLVRGPTGSEVLSETTLYASPTETCPAGSRVTLPGRVTTAINSITHDGGGLPTPDHLEVALL